jgi:ABC-type dipeptide/oligopeptide/nickel transport system permease subunit
MRRIKRFFSHWQNWLGTLIVLLFAVVALTAPLLSQPNKTTQGAFKKVGRSTDFVPHPPSENAILGTLPGQIDVFHALVWGTRDAMIFGLSVALGSFFFGSIFGAISGYAGGLVNNLMMRIADAFLTFPVLAGVVFLQQLVAITIESLGGTYWFNNDYHGQLIDFQFTPPAFAVFLMKVDPILISLIIFSWMPIARIVNTMVVTLKNTEFIQATRALGGSSFWIIRRHLLPNSIGPAIVLASRDVGSSVILQATITFIGLGGASPWGILLSMGRNWVIGPGGNLLAAWWVFLPVTFVIVLFGLGWNLVGDGLTEALEPSAATYEGAFFSKLKPGRAKIDAPVSTIPQPLNSVGNLKSPAIPSVSSFQVPMGSLTEKSPLLQVARDAIMEQNIDQAVHAYSHLIKHRKHVSEIRHDLVQIVRQFPRHAIVWTLLGDALAQEGNQEFANKAYEQARHLTQ